MIGSVGWDGKLSELFVRFAVRDIRRAVTSETRELEEQLCDGLDEALVSSNFFVLCCYAEAFRRLAAEGGDLMGLLDYWRGEFLNEDNPELRAILRRERPYYWDRAYEV